MKKRKTGGETTITVSPDLVDRIWDARALVHRHLGSTPRSHAETIEGLIQIAENAEPQQ